jgi:DNA invertase Pin-like site-specific DNA recombinase
MPDFRPPPGPGSEVALLGRVSKDDTDFGMSAKGQMTRGKKQIAQRSWVLAYEFEEVGSASRHGTKPRQHWEQCQRLARREEGALRVFMIDRVNRLSRIGSAGIKFLEDCRDSDIRIHVIKENDTYDLSVPAKFELLCHAVVKAAADTDESSVAIADGKQSARELARPDAQPPYGLRRVYDPETRQYVGQEIIEGPTPVLPGYEAPSRPEVVLEIIRRVAARWSYKSIQRDLEARGILSPRGKPRWDLGTIKYVAGNVAYLGLVPLEPARYGRSPGTPRRKYGSYDENDRDSFKRGNWPAIVTGEDIPKFWAAVARVTAQLGEPFGGGGWQRDAGKLSRKVTHLLTCGGLRCGYVMQGGAPCGEDTRYGGIIHGRPYLQCGRWSHNAMPEELADAHVGKIVRERIAVLLRAGFDGRGGVELLKLRERLAKVNKRLGEAEAELSDEDSVRSTAELNRAIGDLKGKRELLTERIRQAAVPVFLTEYGDLPAGPEVSAEELAESIERVWDKATLEAQRAVLGGIAESVTLLSSPNPGSRYQDTGARIVPVWLPLERFLKSADESAAADDGIITPLP